LHHRLPGGEHWEERRLRNIGGIDYRVILFSSRSLAREGLATHDIREAVELGALRLHEPPVVILVRLDDCPALHTDAASSKHFDLFQNWPAGVERLCNSFGITHYTHRYVATGPSKNDAAFLMPATDPIPDDAHTKLVNLTTLPSMSPDLVPTEGLLPEGIPREFF
jgi:hypothetical protein